MHESGAMLNQHYLHVVTRKTFNLKQFYLLIFNEIY